MVSASPKEIQFPQTVMATKECSVFYGEKAGVKKVSMMFTENHVTALIGPSGCGKSTYLRALNRMNDFIEGCRVTGEVLLNGQDIYSSHVDPVLVRRHIGMVFQKPNPFPKSIYENIAWGPRRARFSKKIIAELVEDSLKKAALWDEVKDRLHTSALGLSGGQQQRLCIARALAMRPSVLLMDEPCSALDPIATSRIEELILTLKEHYTIIIVTHNMQQAERVAGSTAFFLHGEMLEHAPTKELFNSPRHPEAKRYLAGAFG